MKLYTLNDEEKALVGTEVQAIAEVDDLEAEKLTTLKICPFAAMDATFLRHLNAPPNEVPEAVGQLADAVRSVGGTLRLLWHNESLAPEGQWSQWEGVYPAVLDAALGTDA